MTLFREARTPARRRRVRWLLGAALVGAGVVGQQIATAVEAAAHTDYQSGGTRYEIDLMLADYTVCPGDLGPGMRDLWDRPYRVFCERVGDHTVVFIVSSGRDGVLGTRDDIVGIKAVGR